VPGGTSSREAFALLRGRRGAHAVGMDLVEIAPSLDHAELTCHLGAQLLKEGFARLPQAAPPRGRLDLLPHHAVKSPTS
jgi:agmatinase